RRAVGAAEAPVRARLAVLALPRAQRRRALPDRADSRQRGDVRDRELAGDAGDGDRGAADDRRGGRAGEDVEAARAGAGGGMSRVAALLFALLAAPAPAQTLSGTLAGAGGAPLPAAHAFLVPAGGYDPVAQTAVGEGGRFALAASPGLYTLRLTGVHHRPLDVPLWLDDDVEIDARLAAVPVFGSPEDVRAQVHRHLVYRLERQPDGAFAATVRPEADTLAYRIAGAFAHGRPAAGTAADRFAYDGDGGYFSVLDAPADSVALSFDPRRIPRSDALPEVDFADPASRA